MKKSPRLWILTVISVFAFPLIVPGQGTLHFANSTDTRIINSATGEGVRPGDVRIGLFYSLELNAEVNPMAPLDGLQLGAVTDNIAPVILLSGVFSGGDVTIPNTMAGTEILVHVRAWTGEHNSWEEAFAGYANLGYSNPFTVVLGGGATPPSNLANAGFMGFSISVPEPSVSVVLGLGTFLGMLCLYGERRKKV